MRCYVRRCSHGFADLSPIDACVSSRVREPDRACTNHSTDGGANTGRTSQKTGTANHHLSPWILEVLASEQRLSSETSGRCNQGVSSALGGRPFHRQSDDQPPCGNTDRTPFSDPYIFPMPQ